MSVVLKQEGKHGMARPWDGFVPEEELTLYRNAGFGQTVGIGKRPALLVIDVQYRSMGHEPKPLAEAIKEYPTSCGEIGWRALPQIVKLIKTFRDLSFPIIYPYVALKSAHDAGQFGAKVPGVMSIPDAGYAFLDSVKPMQGDILIPKFHASAFSGTPLVSYLVGLGVDSVVISGCTTSGCVRSSTVDACSLNYKAIIPEDAVYDRSRYSHAINLFDMASKYADVMPTQALVGLLQSIPAAGERT